jgi:hypothetical protein
MEIQERREEMHMQFWATALASVLLLGISGSALGAEQETKIVNVFPETKFTTLVVGDNTISTGYAEGFTLNQSAKIDGSGFLHRGNVSCIFTSESASQSANGYCLYVDTDKSQVFERWNCSWGESVKFAKGPRSACVGTSELFGGSGAYEGIMGTGKFYSEEFSGGVASFSIDDITYTLP